MLHTSVHQDSVESIANGLFHELGSHRAVDTAGDSANLQ